MSKKQTFIFNNRELSWLNFNRRVLEEGLDASNPVLERLKFLSIFSSNLDEFFMVRVGGLQALVSQGKAGADQSGWLPAALLKEIGERVHAMVALQYECFMQDVKVKLRENGIRRLLMDKMTPAIHDHLENVFEHDIYPVITPIALRDADDLPHLPGLGVMLLVRLKADEATSKRPRYAVVLIPKKLGRFITAPIEEGHNYVLIEDVVTEFIDRLFPGEPVAEVVPFRITRNADMGVREDLAGDLLSRMKNVLVERKQSQCVRLEVSAKVSKTSLSMLEQLFGVDPAHVFCVPGTLDLSAYFGLARMTGFDHLREKPWPPQQSPAVPPNTSIFDAIAKKDILLHHPYESFDPVVKLVEEAADDPNVLAIKQILYRTSENSPIVAALARAANRDKHVTAIVELKARFDEARNIGWAEALEQSGVQVIYGIKGLKTHAKVCVVVRREPGGIRRYVHYGTGNYNENTARLYTDVSYMTCREDFCADATAFFNMISGYSQPVAFRKIEAAPIGLRARLLQLIEGETMRSEQGQPAKIMARINALVDEEIISALYRASQAGVKIQLNVRGACCLRAGVAGQSENIEVISIVDRFLEHSRMLYFHHGGEPQVFISSADWMPRNLDRRVELLVPIDDEDAVQRIMKNFEIIFRDNTKARKMKSDGAYELLKPGRGSKPLRSQEWFYQQACEANRQAKSAQPVVFEPERPSALAKP